MGPESSITFSRALRGVYLPLLKVQETQQAAKRRWPFFTLTNFFPYETFRLRMVKGRGFSLFKFFLKVCVLLLSALFSEHLLSPPLWTSCSNTKRELSAYSPPMGPLSFPSPLLHHYLTPRTPPKKHRISLRASQLGALFQLFFYEFSTQY